MNTYKFNLIFKYFKILLTKRYILTFIVFSLSYIMGMGQKSWFEDQTPYSPNVSALGKFGDITVGNYTGTPQIDIPIYIMESGPIKVPITLKYHASGVRVNDMASWVGLGWALDAGGYVARRVRSVPDEGPKNGSISATPSNGYYRNYGPNMVLPNAPENFYVIDGILNGSHDAEPDLYFFSFGSYSGSFFFDQYRKPQLLPEQDLKIDVVFTEGDPGKFNQFIITTPEGVKYYFGGFGVNNVEAIEYTYPNYPANFVNKGYISNWYLTKVATNDNTDEITFEYIQEGYQFYNLAQFQQTVKDGDCGGLKNVSPFYSEDRIEGVRLSKIKSNYVTTEFLPDLTTPRKDVHGGSSYILKTISIIPNSTTGTTKNFELTTHWENCPGLQLNNGSNPELNEDKWRLFLDQVQENVGSSQQKPPYKFSYYQLPSSTDPTDIPKLTRRLSYDQDHWGYFNNGGNTYTKWLLPIIPLPGRTCSTINNWGGANREPSWPAMRAGTIKSIQYPTGGKSNFEFESHNHYVYWSEPLIEKTFPISVGHGQSTGTSTQTVTNYRYPFPTNGELYSAELSATVTITSSSQNCAQVTLYNVINGSDNLLAGFSIDCSQGQNPSKTISVPLISGQTYNLKLVATNCMAQLIVTSTKIVDKEGYKNIGGLRALKIQDSSSDNSPIITKEYQYSGAVLFSVPTYFREIFDNIYTGYLKCNLDNDKKLYEISSGCVMPMITSQGSHIGYGTVIVTQAGLGKSVFKYQNNPDPYMITQFNVYPTPPPPYILGNGNLIQEIYFNQTNDTVKQIKYIFENKKNTYVNASATVVSNIYVPGGCKNGADINDQFYGFNISRSTDYSQNTGYSRIQKKIVADFLQGGVIRDTILYEYSPNYVAQVSSEVYTKSDKKVIKKITMYPKDYLPDYLYNPDCYDQLVSNKQSCLVAYNNGEAYCDDWSATIARDIPCDILQTLYNYGSCAMSCENRRNCYRTDMKADCVASGLYLQNFKDCNTNSKNQYITCINNYNASYYGTINTDKINADETTKILYQMWETNKILPVEQTVWIKDNQNATNFSLVSGDFFDYGRFTNTNTGLEDIKLRSVYVMPQNANFLDFEPSKVVNKVFSKDSRYELKVSASYTKGRLTEHWENNNIHTQYSFGYKNSFPIIKAENIDDVTLNTAVSSLKSDMEAFLTSLGDMTTTQNKADWATFNTNLRNIASLKGALITTYTYMPLVGLTSVTSPNGVTTYYEYDAFGRLSNVKNDDQKLINNYIYHYGTN